MVLTQIITWIYNDFLTLAQYLIGIVVFISMCRFFDVVIDADY